MKLTQILESEPAASLAAGRLAHAREKVRSTVGGSGARDSHRLQSIASLAPPTELCKPRTACRALQASHRLQSLASLAPPTELCRPCTAYRALLALHCLQHDCAAPWEPCIAYSASPTLHCLQHDCTAPRETLHCLQCALSQTYWHPTA